MEDVSKENWDPIAATCSEVVLNKIRIRTLTSLLIEKGILTQEECDKRFQEIKERDFDNLRDCILEGIPELGQK